METSFTKSFTRPAARGFAERWIEGYFARRYGFGPDANRAIAKDFDSHERTVRLWREGVTLPAPELIAVAMMFDLTDRGLDRLSPSAPPR